MAELKGSITPDILQALLLQGSINPFPQTTGLPVPAVQPTGATRGFVPAGAPDVSLPTFGSAPPVASAASPAAAFHPALGPDLSAATPSFPAPGPADLYPGYNVNPGSFLSDTFDAIGDFLTSPTPRFGPPEPGAPRGEHMLRGAANALIDVGTLGLPSIYDFLSEPIGAPATEVSVPGVAPAAAPTAPPAIAGGPDLGALQSVLDALGQTSEAAPTIQARDVASPDFEAAREALERGEPQPLEEDQDLRTSNILAGIARGGLQGLTELGDFGLAGLLAGAGAGGLESMAALDQQQRSEEAELAAAQQDFARTQAELESQIARADFDVRSENEQNRLAVASENMNAAQARMESAAANLRVIAGLYGNIAAAQSMNALEQWQLQQAMAGEIPAAARAEGMQFIAQDPARAQELYNQAAVAFGYESLEDLMTRVQPEDMADVRQSLTDWIIRSITAPAPAGP